MLNIAPPQIRAKLQNACLMCIKPATMQSPLYSPQAPYSYSAEGRSGGTHYAMHPLMPREGLGGGAIQCISLQYMFPMQETAIFSVGLVERICWLSSLCPAFQYCSHCNNGLLGLLNDISILHYALSVFKGMCRALQRPVYCIPIHASGYSI